MKVLSLLAASAMSAPAEIQAAARNETEPVKTPPGSAMVLYANSKKPHLKSFLIDFDAVVNPNFNFEMGAATNVDQSCSLVFQDKMYVLGSEDEKYQIAEVTDCGLKRIGDLSFRFVSGSCANMYDQFIVMCFDLYDQKQCRKWDLQEFSYMPTAGSERVHSNIVHYKDQVLATGGCEKLDNCYNTVEAFDWATETWVEKSAIPLPAYSGYAVTLSADKSAVLYFGGVVQTRNPPTVKDVHKFQDNVWTKLGELNAVRAGHRVLNNQDQVMIIGGLHPRLIEICEYKGETVECRKYEHLDDQLSYWPEPFLVPDDYCNV